RCLIADVGGVGRDYPLSMEKLSPILAFYVVDGIQQGTERSREVLQYGGMGHTAGLHTRSREVAVRVGSELPASRIPVNTPTTHGAIGFSTALPPSMTLGCGSWGGNVTSDNVSPLHLMDIKRVAFETRPVKSSRPAVASRETGYVAEPASSPDSRSQPVVSASGGKINRAEIAAIVDRFLAGRRPEELEQSSPSPLPAPPSRSVEARPVEAEAGSMYTGPSSAGRDSSRTPPNNVERSGRQDPTPRRASNTPGNGHTVVDFVSEDDVRRAIQKGEKIYINAKTIITPAARDIGEPGEIFVKG
ncbi:MAG: hypothetical protein ND895_07840, partial [Pyrinomonadaceae bacterium]|nr:hypothetical protein [Pyrinomonadaceae bacterium]